jgi:hypothetical protein
MQNWAFGAWCLIHPTQCTARAESAFYAVGDLGPSCALTLRNSRCVGLRLPSVTPGSRDALGVVVASHVPVRGGLVHAAVRGEPSSTDSAICRS